jgi:hypothetical protein
MHMQAPTYEYFTLNSLPGCIAYRALIVHMFPPTLIKAALRHGGEDGAYVSAVQVKESLPNGASKLR